MLVTDRSGPLSPALWGLNEAVGACQQLVDAERDPDQKAALEHIRSSAFEIRDDIVELRRELK